MKKILFLLIYYILFLNVTAQNIPPKNDANFMQLSLEDLLNLKFSIASKKELTYHQSPGVVSVIYKEEIKNLGATDLIDVLRFIPGLDFGSDAANYVGLGVRGNWASEGKISILIDGIEMNELLYGNMPFGNHFSVDNILRIEIIRGPGSAIYGGTSELGVINIITKNYKSNNIKLNTSTGFMQKGLAHSYLSLNANHTFSNELKISLNGFLSTANRSDKQLYDYFYEYTNYSYNMMGNSKLNNKFLKGALEYKNLQFNFLIDQYVQYSQDGAGFNTVPGFGISGQGFLGKSIPISFNTYSTNISYDLKVSKKLKFKPYASLTYQKPYAVNDTIAQIPASNRTIYRTLGKIESTYNPTKKINIIGGYQIYQDYGITTLYKNQESLSRLFTPDSTTSVNYHNHSVYGQFLIENEIIDVTMGARYEKHSIGYNAFVPRIAFTKKLKTINFKLLIAQAFRVPFIGNISHKNIKPEKSTNYEIEVGYRLNKDLHITSNIFYTSIHDVLVYSLTNYQYINSGVTGTHGIESTLKYKKKWGYINLNYSYYRANKSNNVNAFEVNPDFFKENAPINAAQTLLGFSPHKFNAIVNWKINEQLNINLNANYLSKKYGYDLADYPDFVGYIQSFHSIILLNTFINYENFMKEGLNLGIGCSNILNQNIYYIQPYTSSIDGLNGTNNVPITFNHSPIPGSSRSFYLKLAYTIK